MSVADHDPSAFEIALSMENGDIEDALDRMVGEDLLVIHSALLALRVCSSLAVMQGRWTGTIDRLAGLVEQRLRGVEERADG